MKRYLLLILLCIYSMCRIMAQDIIWGKVVDENKNPLPYVSVVLQHVQDSSYVSGVTSDVEGVFRLPVQSDREYALLVSYIGYVTVRKACKAGNVGTIVMKEDAVMLEEVNVIASRIRHNANGYTVNLRSSDILKGKQSTDALVFLPGITKEDDSYKINGLPVSEIYVDGIKLANMDELKNLPADMIERVKVNYLAGSNQNAALTGGTIDISLRQPPQGGYYGSLSGGATFYPDYGFSNENVGGVIRYRYKNLNVYDNLSLNFNQPEETADQAVWNQSTGLRTQINEETKYRGHNINNRLSLTQQINGNHSLGASYYVATNRLKASSLTIGSQENAIRPAIESKDNYLDQEATLKYTAKLSRRGTTLDITGDYFNRQSDNRTSYSYGDNTSDVSEDESSLDMYKLSVDVTDPRSQKLVWKYGASVQYIVSDYHPAIGVSNQTDRFQTSQTATTTKGLTPLAYVSAIGQIWKINYSVGVNWQLNEIKYKTLDDGIESSDTQWGINPTVQLMMPLDKKGEYMLMLNYKRTLDDIPYAAISSTVRWSDPYNYTIGNPDLKAPTADMLIAGASLFRNLLNLTAVYSHTKDNIYWETRQSPDASDVFYTIPVNLPSADFYGIGVELNLNPVKPWRMKASGRLEIHPEDVTLDGIYYGKTRLRQYYAIYNTFAFNHGWGGMLNLICEPTFKTYDRTYHTVYNIGGQVYKTMCKDKLQLTFMFNALGDRRKYDRYANGNKVTYDFTTPVQYVGVSLIWRFSGGKQVNVNAIESGSQNFKEIKDVIR